ncbi:MAG TPA: outer membrane beta-barrel protein [Vicinamibacterales bacterium]|nr:outer membrane beta-barrel protein [Vicinamibacterales bacterium]
MRTSAIGLLAAVLLAPVPGFAQDGGSIGIGPRLTFVRGSADSPDGTQRFTGGALRMGGGRAAVELAMDYRSDVTGDLTERIKSYPIQASLLLYPVRARVAPYVLAGVGWYTQQVTHFSAPTGTIVVSEETTRRRGYHAGVGAEVRVHRRFGLYGDYRYTRLRFNDEDESSDTPGLIPFAERLKLSHEGTMLTWGLAFYF